MSMKLDELLHEDATWEQLRRPVIAVLSNLDNELKQMRRDIYAIKRRIEVLENRGKFVDGVWGRFGDVVFKVVVTVLCGYLMVRFGLNS